MVVITSAGLERGSRRELITGSSQTVAAGAAAILIAGCSKKSSHPRVGGVPASARSADVELLNRMLDLEYATIAAYTAGIPLLSGAAQSAAQRFLAQELSHAGELSGLVKQARAKPHLARSSYDLGHPRRPAEVLKLLEGLERQQLTAYLAVIPLLSPSSLRAAVASIFANDAQHISVLRSLLGQEPLPGAFVTGRG